MGCSRAPRQACCPCTCRSLLQLLRCVCCVHTQLHQRRRSQLSAHTPPHTHVQLTNSPHTHAQLAHPSTHSQLTHTHMRSSAHAHTLHTPLHRPHTHTTHTHACVPHSPRLSSARPGLKARVQGGHSSHLVPALLSWGAAAFTGVTDRLGGDLSPQRGPGYIPKRRACLCLLCPVSFLHCGHILSDLHPTRAPSPGGGLRCRSTRQLFLWVSQARLPLGPPQSTGPYTS